MDDDDAGRDVDVARGRIFVGAAVLERQRAALLAEPAGNTGRRITCPYHSWVYDLDGRLAGYPDAGNFGDLDRDCVALTSVRCETWGPLVFVNLSPDAPPLLDWLAPISEDLSELGDLDGRLRLAQLTVRDLDVNWKLPVDANIETSASTNGTAPPRTMAIHLSFSACLRAMRYPISLSK